MAGSAGIPGRPHRRANLEIFAFFPVLRLSCSTTCYRRCATITDIAAHVGDGPFLSKCVLLTDGTNTWPGFEQAHQGFVEEIVGRGMRTSTCADYWD